MEDLRQYRIEKDYALSKDTMRRFLFTFESAGTLKYMAQIKTLPKTKTIDIDVADILEDGNTDLYAEVLNNTCRYREIVYEIVDEMLKEEEIEMPKEDLFFEHRKARVMERYPNKSVFEVLTKSILRYYSVNIYRTDFLSFNQVTPDIIGSLVCIRGIISKASDVHPSISVAVFMCDSCTSEVFQEVEGETFLPLSECQSEKCRAGRTKGTLHLQTRPSKFRSKQVFRIQELSSEVEPGRVPRSLNVEVYDGLVRAAVPGTEVAVSGIFLPKPNEGIQKMRMGLLSDTYILGSYVCPTKKASALPVAPRDRAAECAVDAESEDKISNANDQQENILGEENSPGTVDLMAKSIAPEISGMDDIKKLLLLMLIGGDTCTEGGLRIRGEINILLVGDPGVAKSQLLKAVCRLSPRGIFTTGKGASGAGLTACVSRDSETGEHILEGGALVMSDGGICCIDEFDKMHESDRSCVHEAMEQHRISISKAGINTTLNARCSVLAAANPIKGRYVEKKGIAWNAGLPTALISRFDAVKVIQDIAGKGDEEICKHILGVHKRKGAISGVMPFEKLALEINKCKLVEPSLGPGVQERIVSAYSLERAKDAKMPGKGLPGTARRVLSVLRFSQALAKAHRRKTVTVQDVEEVLRLLGCEAISIYDIIMEMPGGCSGSYKVLELDAIYQEASRFDMNEIDECIRKQVDIGAWSLNGDKLTIFT
ncbi:DNA replication licensing factor MCM7 [Nematocida parisii]|uniref:DNA replication licensing factor MCM7 n=1 Tax=Nematocida parisii (strain ERTm3) TaxID=935791 RepID=I3EGK6_NEMP3|nr:DNA replication licensing factor [Nematocida parisii ERTm1]EIJ88353.1 DNA replication licensing factor [Nematocida parisii ERTm3]KAI5127692.1 DNA replication licensing factor MCM7 [Nematocida parisii]EIJ93581.1 DNA replication licensing factor [Nematocida parisii ERTm1]KAI5129538.1 DNA replication licensing factor MCM7 [Nematocida parisii]KAI5141260.1 DNA replication licensing factor MCM7 [Nematocida parisii]|eukprot:XP_013058981.1 DNA replication licensing factor [Nematocida parisii ERTm1]